ncbi:MAG: transcription-repair coupling factor [Chlamydiia bacterium]|nr:transcription-repair coupling factor [Chlamydiia bacterium]
MRDNEKVQSLLKVIEKGQKLVVEGLFNAPKAFLLEAIAETFKRPILVLGGKGEEEARLYHDFAYFGSTPVIDYPAWETLPGENIAPSPDIVGERYQSLSKISVSKEPVIVLSTLQAALQKLIPPALFMDLSLKLEVGMKLPFEAFQEKLQKMGYQKTSVAADKGEFSVRGGIIDFFPVSSPDPFRLEFFGDELESIRTYDPIGQRSIMPTNHVEVTAALELEMLGDNAPMATLFDYLPTDTIVVLDDLLALEDRWASLKKVLNPQVKSFCTFEEFLELARKKSLIFFPAQPLDTLSDLKPKDDEVEFETFGTSFSAVRKQSPFLSVPDTLFLEEGEDIEEALSRYSGELKILSQTDSEETKFKAAFKEKGLSFPQKTHFEKGYLSSGFSIMGDRQLIFPLQELSHRFKIRRQKQRSTYHTPAAEAFSLTPGECVVHFHNGIGQYLGIETKEDKEYFHIEYADKARLFVPLNQSHLISKYVGATEEMPKLHTLGSNKWKQQKEKTQAAILNYASDLLKIYAEREITGGFQYPPDSEDVATFEAEFPFVETEDQLAATREFKQDMLSNQAMDRLICGDVGYGKTEVAMRAAFKAVLDGGKQVAVLVPTTVLAMQHFENFSERMENFPVNVGVLSRFRKPKQVKETLEGLKTGAVDIVIGTHRVISKDVQFKNLGLIIIDEEQRFGVKAKEHLKKMKAGVDCLTLSATPIPRTLYMSLIGARDMSVINTPPQDRLPIKTILTDKSDSLMKTALLRELSREGQAYVIHNRVETIYGVAEKIKKMLPDAKVAVGHGQMTAKELDDVFHAFKSGAIDILVATTIVENGIDIPRANTILIDRADHFGLAALYQLRGRVGRWSRRAYAYFMVNNLRTLPELSRKRLQALSESSGYGGGMKLAMRDLELRGAGDILGYEQSGHVATIGFHLYCKLLKRTVQTLQGKIPPVITETKLEIPVDARLPDYYINEVTLRMEFYQRLGEALSKEEVDAIFEEMKDRFGEPPEPALWLLHLSRVRVLASKKGYTLVKAERKTLLTERKKGVKVTTNRQFFSLPNDPQAFEDKLRELL